GLLALGDYLDPGHTFALEQGGTTIPLTGVVLGGSTLLAGTVDLGTAPAGAYDLVCRSGGAAVATLNGAFGLGAAPGCGDDQPMELPDYALNSFGSQRKAAFDPEGRVHYAWLGYNGDLGTHEVHQWIGDGNRGASDLVYRSPVPLRDLAFALGPEGDPHFVFVADDGGSEELHYIRADQHFRRVFNDGVRSPALAVDADRRAMIVFESDIMAASWLFYLEADDDGLGSQTDLISGAGARQPDVSLAPDGFVLTYVRDFWFPGLREVCRQHYADGSWQAPASIYFGVTVTSPTVAWDGGEMLLFGWVLDNAGNQPLLHTMRMVGGVPEAVRWRLGDGLIYRCSVAATGPRAFRLMTQESESGVPMKVYLRSGDGNVFHARRRVNTRDDVDFPVLAAERGGSGLFAAWQDYDLGHTPVSYYFCRSPVSALPMDVAAARGLQAYPNPFNPRTTFRFVTATPGQAELEVYDLRGRLVRRLHTGPLPAGAHAFVWDGEQEGGRRSPSGVYFGRLRTGGGELTAKVLLLK
ncbi:MAG: FlgD immunoglobulin-like domain containing protein, partial [Candidatus Krumholzibacteriia bacterium]